MPLKLFGGSLLLPLRIDGFTFQRLGYTGSVDERVSAQLSDQLPDHIINNYDTFVQFIDAYYEWSEFNGNPRGEGVRLNTYMDVDLSLDKFLSYFKTTYLNKFPEKLADGVNEKNLIKNVKDLYKAKGSKKSYDLLFRVLFDTTVDVDYPKDRILKLSTSTFDDRQFIRITPTFSIGKAKTLENQIVFQKFKNNIIATALIDQVDYKQEGAIDFYSLAVQDVSGTFVDNQPVIIISPGNTGITGVTSEGLYANILPTLDSMTINYGGTGYNIGDKVVVSDLSKNKLLDAIVDNIGPEGSVRGFNYSNNFGVYRSDASITYTIETFGGTGLSLSSNSQTVLTDGPDSYKDETGMVSGRSFIQDSFFYQNFSYILRVNKSLEEFADAVRTLVHPSGTLLFAEYINTVSMSGGVGFTSDSRLRFMPTIGHYICHTFGTTIDPRGFTFTTGSGSTHYDFYPDGWNGVDISNTAEFLPNGVFGNSNSEFGNTFASLPHLFPEQGVTHNPDIIKIGDKFKVFNKFQGPVCASGAIGSISYIGHPADDDGDGLGLLGQYSVNSNLHVTGAGTGDHGNQGDLSGLGGASFGVTHYGGYTVPPQTGISGGYSGGQIVQVVGADAATADYWVVYRHINSIGLTALGITGTHNVYRIPMSIVEGATQNINIEWDRGGNYRQTPGSPLNAGNTYVAGEIVRQKRLNEPEAIGRVREFIPSAYHQGNGEGYFNLGVDILEVEVLNGKFEDGIDAADFNQDGVVNGLDLVEVLSQFGQTAGSSADINQDGIVDGSDLVVVLANWGKKSIPIIGDTSGCSRLIDGSYSGNIHTSITHYTSWMDVPLQTMISSIEYSNVTN